MFSHVTHTYTLPTEVREADEVFPEVFILLNIQKSANQRVLSIVVSPRLGDLKNRKSEKKRRSADHNIYMRVQQNKDKQSPISYPSQVKEDRRQETVNTRIV